MPNTLQGVINYARNNQTRDNGSWAGWCASFVYRAGGFSRAFESALIAGNNAGWLNPDYTSAPPGAIHYWAGVGGLGHTAFDLGGGNLLMASASVDDFWGAAMGTVSFQRYARLGLPYRGWSMNWGSEKLSGSTPSVQIDTGSQVTIPKEEDNMYDANARSEVVGRLDRVLTILDDLGRWKQSGANAALPPVYYRPDGMAGVIDVQEGYRHVFGSAAELANYRRLGLASLDARPVSAEEFTDLLNAADSRLKEIQNPPAG